MTPYPERHPDPAAPDAARPALNDRQLECLAWAQLGKSASDIGQILGISGRTVEYHLARALEQLGVRTRVQGILRARALGLLRDGEPRAAASRSFQGPRED